MNPKLVTCKKREIWHQLLKGEEGYDNTYYLPITGSQDGQVDNQITNYTSLAADACTSARIASTNKVATDPWPGKYCAALVGAR